MDEQELDEQLQKVEQDTQVQAAEAAATQAPPPKKRITVAELNKAIDDIRDVKFPETLEWLGELATRSDKIEGMGLENLPSFISDTTERFQKMEKGIAILQNNQSELMKAFLNEQERTDTLQAMIKDPDIPKPAATPQPPEHEIEFAQPPQQRAGGMIHGSDVEAVAQVAQSLTDVLMICRALKAAPNVSDAERIRVLHVACERAGETLTPGLHIRAGVRNVEA